MKPQPAAEGASIMSVTTTKRELAHRASNGVSVSLYWEKVGNTLSLEVYDERSEEFFQLDVPKDRAMDAFHHPYVYRARAEAWELAGSAPLVA
jgi:hypothetical protein